MNGADDDTLRSRFEAASRFWQGITLKYETFARHVRQAAPDADAEALCTNDLFLAAAAAAGDAVALRALDEQFVLPARSSIERVHRASDFVEDVLQELRSKLLLAPDARLRRYPGRSPLEGWIRVTASRLAYEMARARIFKNREVGEDDLERRAADAIEPELATLKQRVGPVFQQAIRAAMESLSARERTVLWMHLVDGLSIDQIARPYNVHRATAARWLGDIKEKVIAAVHDRVREAHPVLTTQELASLGRLVLSQLHISLAAPSVSEHPRAPGGGSAPP